MAAGAAVLLLLLVWEIVSGPGGPRWAGYLLSGAGMLVTGAEIVRRWRAAAQGEGSIAGRLERLFPQARGVLTDALASPIGAAPPGSLERARASAGAGWIERRTVPRLDGALAVEDRGAIIVRRRLALALLLAVGVVAFGEPMAARRLAGALKDPGYLWSGSSGTWTVLPGDRVVAFGKRVDGRARFAGPAAEGPLVLESRRSTSSWLAETLAAGPAGTWSWPSVRAALRYRVRYGPFQSPEYRIDLETPFAVERVEARLAGEAWVPLAGRIVPAEEPLEIRGTASRLLLGAGVRLESAGELPLEVDGTELHGTVRVPAGAAWIVIRDPHGESSEGARFRAAPAGAPFVEILRPESDPLLLATEGAWIEVRAGAPAGLGELRWEIAGDRAGALAAVAGTRDTTVAAVVPLGAGREPGDTVRYRVVARTADRGGRSAASGWRTAILAEGAALETRAAAARAEAAAAVDRALAALRESPTRASGDRDSGEAARALDRSLQTAADSLARALDRTLAGSEMPAGLAERLQGYRQLLEGAAGAPLRPPPGLPEDPAAAAHARASVLEAIREGLAQVEKLLALSRAADTLAQLAVAEEALAERTRRAAPGELESGIAERQAALAEEARSAAAPLADSLTADLERALGAAEAALSEADPAAAAAAQDAAAGALSDAAAGARREVQEASAHGRAQRAAMDRAGAETLFLADRQRDLAERIDRPVAGSAEHAERVSRQQVVTRGLDATLGALVEAIGGRPAGFDLARRLAEAVFATRYAEEAVSSPPGRGRRPDGAAAATRDAARALAGLSRAFLLPEGESGGGAGAGAQGDAGAVARRLEAMAGAERSLADVMSGGTERGTREGDRGGNAEAAATQRGVGRQLGDLADELRELGVDPRTIQALAESVERTASRLERGLPGAESETDLRALARRFADLGRIIEQSTTERRRSETARAFLPADPPPLPERTTAPRLDPEAALAAWEGELPSGSLPAARAYLERLAAEGVRAPGGSP